MGRRLEDGTGLFEKKGSAIAKHEIIFSASGLEAGKRRHGRKTETVDGDAAAAEAVR